MAAPRFFKITAMLPSVITVQELKDRSDYQLVDARSGPGARAAYETAHVKGSVFADLEKDLASVGPDAAKGGRHPLPEAVDFARWLGENGITGDSVVVVFDDKGGANAAARFWWMLRALGHQQVAVLSGGWQALQEAGWPITDEPSHPLMQAPYPSEKWNGPMVDLEQVAEAAQDSGKMIVDVREAYRYRGEKEPIDLVAGHIPGAVNIPYVENLDASGHFLSAEALRNKYTALLGQRAPADVVVHCGSGVTACHTLLALDHAGLSGAALYTGSWSEWSRNPQPVATGDQPGSGPAQKTS